MKKTTKLMAVLGALTLSIGVYAHNNGSDGFGFHHGMMDEDSPQYQTMLKLHNDPEAMQAWAEQMHDNPEAMVAWMQGMHASYKNSGSGRGFGCPMWGDDDDNAPEAEGDAK